MSSPSLSAQQLRRGCERRVACTAHVLACTHPGTACVCSVHCMQAASQPHQAPRAPRAPHMRGMHPCVHAALRAVGRCGSNMVGEMVSACGASSNDRVVTLRVWRRGRTALARLSFFTWGVPLSLAPIQVRHGGLTPCGRHSGCAQVPLKLVETAPTIGSSSRGHFCYRKGPGRGLSS